MFFRIFNRAILAAILLPLFAQAEVRREDTYLWRRAKTLASGQQVFSFQTSYQEFSDRFGVDGRIEPLGNQYANSITLKQLVKADKVNAESIRDYFKTQGLNDDDVVAMSTYKIQRQEIGFGFNWAYGLMRNWQIGIDVPLTLTTTKVQRQVDMTAPLSHPAANVPKNSILAMRSSDLRARIRTLAEQELNESGYDSIPAQKQTWNFGDISLRSQELLSRTYHWSWAIQQLVRFPTAQNPSLADYVQNSQDEGPVNLGMTSLLDYQFKHATAGLRGGYVAQLPDSARMHAKPGSSGVDPKVDRDLGDWLWVAADYEYHITRSFDANIEHSFLSKSRDRYDGDTFTREAYDAMANGTDMQLHQTRVGLVYRIGNVSSRAGISNRWLAELDYTYPWLGHNASEAARTSLEIINYF